MIAILTYIFNISILKWWSWRTWIGISFCGVVRKYTTYVYLACQLDLVCRPKTKGGLGWLSPLIWTKPYWLRLVILISMFYFIFFTPKCYLLKHRKTKDHIWDIYNMRPWFETVSLCEYHSYISYLHSSFAALLLECI